MSGATADAPVPCGFAPAELRAFYRAIYRDAGALERLLAAWRPSICPFQPIADQVPPKARILDFGCGAGALLAALAATGRIAAGVGCDISASAIHAAKTAQRRLKNDVLEFVRVADFAETPAGPFDVVIMVDVLHHIPPARQREAALAAAARVAAGGRLIYKDMAMRPAWRRWANTLHDLVLARQWVAHVPVAEVEEWLRQAGMTLRHRASYARLVYGHELRVFET
jgi:2-polyprenyl-3-methyl-5-hydroxy-6-metoxy-1,4-benzoquinol methylase